jgi:ligand-binding sensor domain-containing protein
MRRFTVNIACVILVVFVAISCNQQPVITDKIAGNTVQEKTDFNPNLYFKEFGVEDGLISTELLNIYNDRRGFTWIATGKGVVRYDGYEFKNYFTDTEKSTYLEGASYFYEDRDNNFWLLSGNGYLHLYDPQADAFIHKKSKLENGWSAENPLRIFEEKNGNLWLGGYGGLQYLNRQTDSLTLYPISKIRKPAWSHEEKVRFEVIQKDVKGNFWLGTRKFGLVKFDPIQKKYAFLRD